MFEHVRQQHLVDRIVGPGPRQCFEIHHLVRIAGRNLVDVEPVLHPRVAATEIEPHEVSRDNTRIRGGVRGGHRNNGLDKPALARLTSQDDFQAEAQ